MSATDQFIEAIADAVARRLEGKLGEQHAGGRADEVRPRLLTVEQAAMRIGRTKEAVQHMVANRKLPIVRDGRRVFLDIEDLDRWIESSKEPARI